MSPGDWTLAPSVHAVEHDEDIVVLDIDADAYFCLPQALPSLRLAPNGRDLVVGDPAGVAAFVQARLIQAKAGDSPPAASRPPPPASSAVKLCYPTPGWRDVGPALVSLFDLLTHYWRRPFARILRAASTGRPRVAATPSAELLQVVDSFHRWIPYAPVSAKCLLRSFMLLRMLARRGHGAHWVFGVSTWPFRAHCWLQCGEVVLDDDAERVAAFAVIMVL